MQGKQGSVSYPENSRISLTTVEKIEVNLQKEESQNEKGRVDSNIFLDSWSFGPGRIADCPESDSQPVWKASLQYEDHR